MLAEILHNIADHADTLLRVLRQQDLDGEFVNRLEQHILLEEKENTQKLEQIGSSNPDPMTQKLLDHSYFIQKVITDKTIPVDLKEELLDHFMEEHQEWQSQSAQDQWSSHHGQVAETREDNQATTGDGWTVGPMWQQGGY